MSIAGVSFQQNQGQLLDWILLDSQSTVDFFANPRLLTNVKKTDFPLCLNTNAGMRTTNLKGTVPDWGEVWHDPKGIVNILSLENMIKRYRVTFDSDIEPVFRVHTEAGIVNYIMSPEGLFYHAPKYRIATQCAATVSENESFSTQRQRDGAKCTRELLHALTCPTIADLKRAIKMNFIQNCPVTVEDINLAKAICGPDVPSLKGKLTRERPSPVVQDYIEIPPELLFRQQIIDRCIDTFFVNGLPFFSSISKRILYRTCN
jgi:hypothetical protein